MRGRGRSDWSITYSVLAGMLLSGVLLVAICLPVSLLSATLANRDPIVSILLLQSRADLASFLAGGLMDRMTYGEASAIFAYLAMIGAMIFCLPLLFLVGRREGIVRLLTRIYGMFLGLVLSYAWFEWANTGRIDWLAPSAFEIAYIYLAFLVAEAAKLSIAHREIAALPYMYAIDGLFGIVAVLIIHVGYQPSFSSLLLGPVFLVMVAIGMLAAEWTFLRPASILLGGLGLTVTDGDFEKRFRAAQAAGSAHHKMLLSEWGARIGEMRRLAYPRRARMIEQAVARAFRQIPRGRRSWRSGKLIWWVVAATSAGIILFMLAALMLMRLIR